MDNIFKILSNVNETIKEYGMLQKGDKILVAVSGGPDSIALLHILNGLKHELHLSLCIAHLNHKLRGKASDNEEEFVQKIAGQMHIPCVVKSCDIKKIACENKTAIEEAAREERYKFFEEAARKLGANKIALAHTADDQVETVLFRLIRGASTGITGIPAVRKLGKYTIIRPLINIWKKDVFHYLKIGKIRYKIDKSNYETTFVRNKIRYGLLPTLIKDFNPNVKEVILNNAKNLSEIIDFAKWEAQKIFRRLVVIREKDRVELDKTHFSLLHPAIRKEVIKECLRKVKGNLSAIYYNNIADVLNIALSGQSGKGVRLPGDITVRKEFDKIIFFKTEKACQYRGRQFEINIPGDTKQGDLSVRAEILDKEKIVKLKFKRQKHVYFSFGRDNTFTEYFDFDSFKAPLFIRTRLAGDKFRPMGLKGEKKVKDIFIEQKVPIDMRAKIPMLVDSDGKILWIAGYRIGERHKIMAGTKRVLKLTLKIILS